MKLKRLFEQLNATIRKSFLRFPVTIVLVAALCAVFSSVVLETELFNLENEYLIIALTTGVLCALIMSLLQEKHHFNRIIEYVLPLAVTVACYILLDKYVENSYFLLGYIGVNFAMLFAILALVFDHEEEDKVLPYLLSKLIYVGALACVAFGGIMICVLAFNFLIYEIDELYKVVALCSIWILCFVPLTLFVSYIPAKEDKLEISKAYSTIFNKVALYIYLLLLLILYAYIIKIVVTRQMPVGRLNWFGSIALLFYVFFYLSLQGEGTIQNYFKKFGAALLVPVLAIQLYAIYVRLSAYGLTYLRYISLALIFIAVLFMAGSVSFKKSSPIWLAAAVIAVLLSIGPLNVIDVPVRNQERRIKAALERNQIYVNGRYNTAKEVSDDDWEIISGSYDYLRYNAEKESDFVKDVLSRKLDELVIRDSQIDISDYKYITYYIQDDTINVEGYSRFTKVYGYDDHLYDSQADFDAGYFFNELIQKAGAEQSISDPVLQLDIDENTRFVFTHISISLLDDSIISIYWEGYRLEK